MRSKISLLLGSIVMIVLSVIIVSCEKEENTIENNVQNDGNLEAKSVAGTIDYENAFNNIIGFVDSESNEFHKLSPEQLVFFWKNILDLDSNIKFTEFKIEKLIDDNDKVTYLLRTRSDSGTNSITHNLNYEASSQVFILGGNTCSCETNACANTFGCEASSRSDGTGCMCSPCSIGGFGGGKGDCKKISATTSEYALIDFNP